MTVQQSAGFGIGLIDRQMQAGIHRSGFANDAIQAALNQIAAAEGIGAAAGGRDPDGIIVSHRGIAAVGVIEAVLAQPVIMSNQIVFVIHGSGLYRDGVQAGTCGVRPCG